MEPAIDLALILSAIFFLGVASVLRVRLFAGRYGRRHRLVGLVYLCWCGAASPPDSSGVSVEASCSVRRGGGAPLPARDSLAARAASARSAPRSPGTRIPPRSLPPSPLA